MTIEITAPRVLALALLLALVGAIGVVLNRNGAEATVAVAPLSAHDRAVLLAERSLITSLPTAIAEVPIAASDASHGRVSPTDARAVIDHTPALSSLSEAIAAPSTVTKPLTDAYEAVLAGHTPASVDDMTTQLETLQAVEGQIQPALRLVAAQGKTAPSAADSLAAVESDPKARELATLLGGWQQVYGTFVLVEQDAAA